MAPLFVLDNTFGAVFIGVIVASLLHGVSVVQAWYYFLHQNDNWSLKGLVTAVMVFDSMHELLIAHSLYVYTITNWGNPEELGIIVWSLIVEVLFNGLTALLVQSFLAMRVWKLSNRNKLLTGVVGILVLAEFSCVVAYTVLTLHLQTFEQLTKYKFLSILVNALAAAGDVLIAATLCVLLHRSRTGFQRSDTMINKLILFAVNTGVLTSLCAVASLISIVVAGNTFIYIAFYFCIGRLYSNSLLATLNARKFVRGGGEGIHTTSGDLSVSLRDYPQNGNMPSGQKNISIKIDTTNEFATDSNRGNGLDKTAFNDTYR
jgi:hypothetical protein